MKFSIERAIDKEARKRTEELREMAADVARKIATDQEEWIDSCMKDILRPDIYEKARHDDCRDEVDDYFHRNKISITFIPDSNRIQIRVRDQLYGEFIPRYEIDGEPAELSPAPLSSPPNN